MTHDRASPFAATPEPPYYIVSFSSIRTAGDQGYGAMGEKMEALALAQDGCFGLESARRSDGFGITISFWRDEKSILAWKNVVSHMAAQKLGRDRWYEQYQVRVARVERAYSFHANEGGESLAEHVD